MPAAEPVTSPLIRRYDSRDREAVVRMLAASEPWIRLGYGQTDWVIFFSTSWPQTREGFVIEAGGAIAGIALLRPNILLGDYLELFCIAPEARRRGLGVRLLAYLEELVFGRTRNFYVCVSDFNKDARRFYESHGFLEIGPIPDLLIPGSAEILMRKTVGPARAR